MADKNIEYSVTADGTPFDEAMKKSAAAAQQAAKDISNSFKSVESSLQQVANMFKTVTAVIGGLTAVMAGGKAFKEVIGASNEWTGEAKKLSVQLGITTERASVMMVAMRHMGMDSEVVTLAAGKMSKQIATNGQAFEKLGVAVKDSTGQYRPSLEIMGEVNAKLKEIKNPIEQNIAGTQVYGKSWSEVRGVMRLTSEEIKAAEQKTKELGLVVGDEGVANAKKYKESINDMKLIMTSLEVQLGAAVIPAFVSLGSWLSGVGPIIAKAMGAAITSLTGIFNTLSETVMSVWDVVADGFSQIGQITSDVMGGTAPSAMEFFVNVLKVVEIAFVGFKVAVQVALEAVMAIIDISLAKWMRVGAVAERVLHLDFAGAKKAWESGTKEIEDVEQRHMDKLVKIAEAGKDKMDDIIMRPSKKETPIKDKKIEGGPTYDFSDGKEDKAKSRMHEWEGKLGAEKDGFAKEQAIAGTAREYSHTQERDYWKKILDTVKMSKEERGQVEKKYYAETAAIRKEAFESEIAGEKASMENFKHNHIARTEIAVKIYRDNVDRYGEESKEAKAAYGEVLKEHKAFADQVLATNKVIRETERNAALAGIDQEEQDLAFKLSLHEVNQAQLLQGLEEFEAKRYQIKMQALQEQEAAMHNSDEDPTALAQIHAQIEAMEQLHQAKLGQIKRQQILEEQKNRLAMYGTVEGGMQRIIAGTMNGTIKMSNIFQSTMQMLSGAVIEMLAKTAAEWVMNSALTRSLTISNAVTQVEASSAVAGAEATASAAAIPGSGWMIAAGAGLAAYAAAKSFMPSFAVGAWDLPHDMIAQVHQGETILPRTFAEDFRNNAGSMGGGGPTVHYYDNSGRLSPGDIRRNAKLIQDVLKDLQRKQS
ncbi:hypothetical protein ACO0K0_02410 [Undibacterium sp. SXout11W]|uniref:hypothetical protein n=1 Tax=Undibacterium sp. SXout11W TaxID=3413050 RepID=UPI003BF205E8